MLQQLTKQPLQLTFWPIHDGHDLGSSINDRENSNIECEG
jgi:hypothetical protein